MKKIVLCMMSAFALLGVIGCAKNDTTAESSAATTTVTSSEAVASESAPVSNETLEASVGDVLIDIDQAEYIVIGYKDNGYIAIEYPWGALYKYLLFDTPESAMTMVHIEPKDVVEIQHVSDIQTPEYINYAGIDLPPIGSVVRFKGKENLSIVVDYLITDQEDAKIPFWVFLDIDSAEDGVSVDENGKIQTFQAYLSDLESVEKYGYTDEFSNYFLFQKVSAYLESFQRDELPLGSVVQLTTQRDQPVVIAGRDKTADGKQYDYYGQMLSANDDEIKEMYFNSADIFSLISFNCPEYPRVEALISSNAGQVSQDYSANYGDIISLKDDIDQKYVVVQPAAGEKVTVVQWPQATEIPTEQTELIEIESDNIDSLYYQGYTERGIDKNAQEIFENYKYNMNIEFYMEDKEEVKKWLLENPTSLRNMLDLMPGLDPNAPTYVDRTMMTLEENAMWEAIEETKLEAKEQEALGESTIEIPQ